MTQPKPWMASFAFGGPGLRTACLGSRFGTWIPFFRPPMPGLPMVHRRADGG
jgi:hypothetical protein